MPSHSEMLTAPRAAAAPAAASLGHSQPSGLIAAALEAAGGPVRPDQVWVIAHSGYGMLAGEAVPSGARVTKGSGRGFLTTSDGNDIFVCSRAVFEEMGQMDVSRAGLGAAALISEASRPEARVLPLRHNLKGERYRDFRESLLHLTGDVAAFPDNPIAGPATLTWLLKHMLENGGSPPHLTRGGFR